MPATSDLYFRDAQPRDADTVGPLLHESSRRLLDHVFGGSDPQPYLRRDFRRGDGIFGWRHLVVAMSGGEVVCTQTYYPGGLYPRLLRASLLSGLMHFGPVELAKLGLRSRALDAMFVPPRADGLFMANGCVAAPWRGKGVFTALIDDGLARARRAGLRVLELDVSFSNAPAQRIFERFGFVITAERAGTPRMDGFRRMERPVA
jgi:GNAT superfamily N-acetyltransferase